MQVVDLGEPVADGNLKIILGGRLQKKFFFFPSEFEAHIYFVPWTGGGFDPTGSNACTAGGGAGVPIFGGTADQWGPNGGYSGGWSSISGSFIHQLIILHFH